MIIIKVDCCGRPQTSSDAMQFKRLDVLRCYAGERVKNKKAHGLKAQPLKDFILGSSPSVNRKMLTHILTNVNTHPATQNF